jgi:diadenosine tetraphosphatase ApaH/serine/threonine PP2A family protein phosphatase
MRYAILSDIHGNAEALRAVLNDIERVSLERGASVDQVWCLGDLVGYGPEPGECVRRIRARCDVCIAGNHDWAAVGKLDLQDFSGAAAKSAEWTREHLSPDERRYLQSVPEVKRVGEFTLAHGSPTNPIWEYLITPTTAAPNFAGFDTLFCVVGHTHLPTIFLQPAFERAPAVRGGDAARVREAQLAMALPGGPSRSMLEQSTSEPGAAPEWSHCERHIPGPGLWMLPPGYRAIINPGSVGQPRDGDPRASYLIYDSTLGFEFRRVPYNIEATQQRIREAGLSPKLAARLARGV